MIKPADPSAEYPEEAPKVIARTAPPTPRIKMERWIALFQSVEQPWVDAITRGPHPGLMLGKVDLSDPSACEAFFVAVFVERGMSDDEIAAIMLHHEIGAGALVRQRGMEHLMHTLQHVRDAQSEIVEVRIADINWDGSDWWKILRLSITYQPETRERPLARAA